MTQFKALYADEAAYASFVIGSALFLSEKTPYPECKLHFKSAAIFAKDPQLKSIALHNLGVLNYVEIMEHNE